MLIGPYRVPHRLVDKVSCELVVMTDILQHLYRSAETARLTGLDEFHEGAENSRVAAASSGSDAGGGGLFGVGALGDDARDDVLGSAGSMIAISPPS